MGCGGSTDKTLDQQKVDDEQNSDNVRKPKISVRIDQEVRVVEEVDKPKILFVFGGPGSRKGRVIDDLVRAFGFIYLNAEDIVMEELPKRLEQEVDLRDKKNLQDLIMASPELFTLEWIMDCIKERIQPCPDHSYLVDIVPNRRLVPRDDREQETCKTVLRRFEDKYPVSFALNLAVPKDKVLEKVEAQSNIQNGNGRSDEVDLSRMQRRLAIYEELARSFLHYFDERMCTVDVSCGVADLISLRVSQLLNEMKITPIRSVNTVVLFSFTGAEYRSIGYGQIEAKKIDMKSFIVDESDETALLRTLSREIDRTPPSDVQVFLVSVEGTVLHRKYEECNANASQLKRRVLFLEEEHDNLDQYIIVDKPGPGQPRMERRKSSVGRQFRSLSTNGNEACLFPMDADLELCKYISRILAEIRDET